MPNPATHVPRDPPLKRPFDVVLSLLGLVLGVPFSAVAALAIKLEDGGPVFHAQERVGRYGRRFRAWKFRSMVPDAERLYGYLQAVEGDGRVTRVGRWLRATALDEWPQLWNILRGDMSFVGPRALLPAEVEVRGAAAQSRSRRSLATRSASSCAPGSRGSRRCTHPAT